MAGVHAAPLRPPGLGFGFRGPPPSLWEQSETASGSFAPRPVLVARPPAPLVARPRAFTSFRGPALSAAAKKFGPRNLTGLPRLESASAEDVTSAWMSVATMMDNDGDAVETASEKAKNDIAPEIIKALTAAAATNKDSPGSVGKSSVQAWIAKTTAVGIADAAKPAVSSSVGSAEARASSSGAESVAPASTGAKMDVQSFLKAAATQSLDVPSDAAQEAAALLAKLEGKGSETQPASAKPKLAPPTLDLSKFNLSASQTEALAASDPANRVSAETEKDDRHDLTGIEKLKALAADQQKTAMEDSRPSESSSSKPLAGYAMVAMKHRAAENAKRNAHSALAKTLVSSGKSTGQEKPRKQAESKDAAQAKPPVAREEEDQKPSWLFLGNIPRGTSQGLLFAECAKYGEISSIDYDTDSLDILALGQALVKYTAEASAAVAVQRLSRRKGLFGAEVPLEVRLGTPEDLEQIKPPVEEAPADSAVKSSGSDPAASSTTETPTKAPNGEGIPQPVLQREPAREQARNRDREDRAVERRGDERSHRDRDVNTLERRGIYRDRAREDVPERERFRERVPERRGRQERPERERLHVRERSLSRERRRVQDERPPRSRSRHRRQPQEDRSKASLRKRKERCASEDSDYSEDPEPSGATASAPSAVATPAERKSRGLGGFDTSSSAAPAAAAGDTSKAVRAVGAPEEPSGGRQVGTRGHWAEFATSESRQYYVNILTGEKTWARPAEFDAAASRRGNGLLGNKLPGDVHSNVYVGGLPMGINDMSFRQLFEPYGNIICLKLSPSKMQTGGNYGFVKYSSVYEAQAAITSVNGAICNGVALSVRFANQDKLR